MAVSLYVLAERENPVLPSSAYRGIFVGKEGLSSVRALDEMAGGEGQSSIALLDEHAYLNVGKSTDHREPILNRAAIARHGLAEPLLPAGTTLVAARKEALETSLETHLSSAHGLKREDLDLFLSFLSDEQAALCDRILSERFEQPLLFIGPAPFFNGYIRQVREIASQLHQRTAGSGYTLERVVSWRGLSNVLLQIHLASGDYAVERCGVVHFERVDAPLSLARWREDSCAVVFAANEAFSPALAVCINSMLDHIDETKFYDIVVLESDITEDSKARLYLLCSRYPTVQLRFFNPSALLSGYTLQKNPNDHISMETYYRFLISDILGEYERVAYLDCDTVIMEDVAKLFEHHVEGFLLAAALDAEIPAQRSGEDPTMEPYLKSVLGLEEGDPYLQAGVLLLNLKEMRSFHSVEEWLTLASKRKYRYNDQDILNKECKGRFSILPMEWNVVVNCNNRRLPIIERGPYEVYAAYMEARKNPKLVHYAGFEKPWDAPYSDFASLFWHYAIDSEFYDRLLSMRQGEGQKRSSVMDILLPRGSRRRGWARRWYYTVFGR